MARVLQGRLALASFKTKHGWENLTLDIIEPKVEKELKRKRPTSSGEFTSDSSSAASSDFYRPAVQSSPILFSEDVRHSSGGRGMRHFANPPMFQRSASKPSARTKRVRSNSTATSHLQNSRASWRSNHNLAQSSPVYSRQYPHHSQNLSFASATSTVLDDVNSPTFPLISDDEREDLPMHSFNVKSSMRSSPPRTPPPTRSRLSRNHIGKQENGKEGADLLLYLATSPSPANPAARNRMGAPATPPSRVLDLPSSMMTTPGGGNGLLWGGPNTPSNPFNFADFVNVTPSPAQGHWNRTPGAVKTPLAAREARRRLNFDALAPPTGSPNLNGHRNGPSRGLGMELGGELV
jgi:Whi5 like